MITERTLAWRGDSVMTTARPWCRALVALFLAAIPVAAYAADPAGEARLGNDLEVRLLRRGYRTAPAVSSRRGDLLCFRGPNLRMSQRVKRVVPTAKSAPHNRPTGRSQEPSSSRTGPSVGLRVPSTNNAGGRTEMPY